LRTASSGLWNISPREDTIRPICLLLLLAIALFPPAAARAGDFFVDAELGRDLAAGTAEAPWKTVWRVARARLSPGDRVFFKRGQTFRGQMRLECAGTAEKPIVFSSYGEGPPPSLRGSALRSAKTDWIVGTGVWYLAGLHRDPVIVSTDGHPGRRVARREDLRDEWDHFYDPHLGRLMLKAEGNPALRAHTVEVGENDYVLGPVSGSHLVFEGLNFAQPRVSIALIWGGTDISFIDCAFTLAPVNHLQFHRQSGLARVSGCRFDDWNLSHDAAYAVQAIEGSGPVDVTDSVFTATIQGGGRDHTAIMGDLQGWIRTVARNRFAGNAGRLADEGVVIWRLDKKADAVSIEDNTFEGLGGTAIILQETGHFGARPRIRVAGNSIRGVAHGDDLDKEALRVRDTQGADVVVEGNVIEGAGPGEYEHDGITADAAPGIRILGNAAHGTSDGLRLGGGTADAVISGNLLSGNRGYGILVMPGSALGTSSDNCLWDNGRGSIFGAPLSQADFPSRASASRATCLSLP